ncbi:MAG: agmatine deiminase family protein [Thermoleophilia bacterium]|nr:agmatine deiminase family protein [Thermoleophilia bacterium]
MVRSDSSIVTPEALRPFRMPAEWERHAACWMAWPCREENWVDIEAARATYVAVACRIAEHEPVRMIARPEHAEHAGCALGPGIEVVPLPTDDSWTRDTAPTFVLDATGVLAGICWRFNAYGGIYARYDETALMARRLCGALGVPAIEAPLVFEGGALHTDGEGTLLTTTEVALDPRRNPGLTRTAAEAVLCEHLGGERVLWLTGALDHDNTSGHVDNLACFAAPGVVLALSEDDPSDSQYAALRENLARLRAARDARGRRLEIIEIPQPRVRTRDGALYSPSYLNFYVANGAVVMPLFDDPGDAKARDTLARAFPGRAVVGVPGWTLARADGGVHCITQQQPIARSRGPKGSTPG